MSAWPTSVHLITDKDVTDGPFSLPDGSPGCLGAWMQRELRVVANHHHSLQMAIDWYDTFSIVHHYVQKRYGARTSDNVIRRICYNVTWCLLGYTAKQSAQVLEIAEKVRVFGPKELHKPIPVRTTNFTSTLPQTKGVTHPATNPINPGLGKFAKVTPKPYIPPATKVPSSSRKVVAPPLATRKPSLPTPRPKPLQSLPTVIDTTINTKQRSIKPPLPQRLKGIR